MALTNLLRRIDLTTLQLFVAINEEGTLTRAARREAIAVSAASKRMVDLEEAVGLALFSRSARGMALTPAGETLLTHARRMLFGMETLGVELAEHAQGVRGHVRMVANLSAIVQFLPEDIQTFLAQHGNIRIDLQESPSANVIKSVADGLADIGICSGDLDTRGLHGERYRRDRLVLVMRADHPLAGRARMPFADTLDEDHVGLHAASSINLRIHWAARQTGRHLKLRIHVPGFDAVCRMAQAGMGIGVIPDGVFDTLGRSLGLAAVELEDEWAQRELRLVVRSADALAPATRALFQHLRGVENRAESGAG
ncbi:MAG: LysR family transcriptional regulator [Burkholderiaceae bacterium]